MIITTIFSTTTTVGSLQFISSHFYVTRICLPPCKSHTFRLSLSLFTHFLAHFLRFLLQILPYLKITSLMLFWNSSRSRRSASLMAGRCKMKRLGRVSTLSSGGIVSVTRQAAANMAFLELSSCSREGQLMRISAERSSSVGQIVPDSWRRIINASERAYTWCLARYRAEFSGRRSCSTYRKELRRWQPRWVERPLR